MNGRSTQRRWPGVPLALLLVAGACTSASPGAGDTVPTVDSTRAQGTTSTSSTVSQATSVVLSDPNDPWSLPFPGPDTSGVLLGFSTGLSRAERPPRWRRLEEDAARRYDIGHVFHPWDRAIPTDDDLMHIADGRLLMISWNGTDTRDIAAGRHDDWIRTQARAVRDLDRRVLLRWLWEMDGMRRRAWVHSGADYVAAWNHIRALFVDEGADNAEWVWCPNEFLFGDGGDPEPWYPGDDNVDWLCADGYNWADSTQDDDWVDLVDIFADFHEWAAPRGLPMMIGETGVGEAEPGAKAEWIRAIPVGLQRELPEIDALVWFDKDFTFQGHRDWRVDTSDDAYAAWLEISNDPWLNPLGR